MEEEVEIDRPPARLGSIHPRVVGFIAYQLRNGSLTPTSLSRPDTPDSALLARFHGVVGRILNDGSLVAFITQYLLERSPRRAAGDQEIKAVMSNLAQHADNHASFSVIEVCKVLPDLDKEIKELVADPPFQPFARQDAHVLALSRWFKHSFMRWVDPIPCPRCGGRTQGIGSDQPTLQESLEGGGRVELHQCIDQGCAATRRFVRYGSVSTLLRTREGRCGEWAHLFYILLLCSGVTARYVWNSEDHVWNEYWSPALGHWVHVDSCEATINKPLLYARGWGKKQAFCLQVYAVGSQGAEDVTRAYVDDWSDCLARRSAKSWSEANLQSILLELTVACRLGRPIHSLTRLAEADRGQQEWIQDEARRLEEAERDELGGRTSGPVDWRAARDELGEGGGTAVVLPHFTVLSSIDPDAEVSGQEERSECLVLGDASQQKSRGIESIVEPRTSGRQQWSWLLTERPGSTSAVFLPRRVSQRSSFRMAVWFRISLPAPGQEGADGMAVVFSSERRLGLGGYGLGYSGIGVPGDFAVEIDTYRTRDFAQDPPTPHISVHSPPNAHHRFSIGCTKPYTIPDLCDGRMYKLEVVYEGAKRRVVGVLGLPEGQGGQEGDLGLWDVIVPAGNGEEEMWYVGLTAACGGLWQKQEVVDWTLEEISLACDGDGELETEDRGVESMASSTPSGRKD